MSEQKSTVILNYVKTTKNTHRYDFVGGDVAGRPVTTSLYIDRYVFGGIAPKRIRVTVEALDGIVGNLNTGAVISNTSD